MGIKASKDRKKKISNVQADGGVKSEKNVIYQGGMRDVRGSLQAPERGEERMEKSDIRASAGPDGAITGSTTAGAGWGHEEGARARLQPRAAGETGRGLGFSRRGRN